MSDIHIAVIGLGYVGLPLARLFATKYPVVGFDINRDRINEINQGHDHTLEVSEELLRSVLVKENPVTSGVNGLFCADDIQSLKGCNFYIVTVPTPVDKNNRPDLTPLLRPVKQSGK